MALLGKGRNFLRLFFLLRYLLLYLLFLNFFHGVGRTRLLVHLFFLYLLLYTCVTYHGVSPTSRGVQVCGSIVWFRYFFCCHGNEEYVVLRVYHPVHVL